MTPSPFLDQWRDHLRHRKDPAALEAAMQRQLAALGAAGLAEDEAFLVAARRLGDNVEWKPSETAPAANDSGRRGTVMACALAILAAVAIKLPALFGLSPEHDAGFYARNLALFVLPILTAYFVWKRGGDRAMRGLLAGAFVVAAVVANVHGPATGDSLEALIALHLPIALWLAVGIAHAGGRWRETAARMDFVRFSGELFIHYVLIALGGAVLTAFTMAMFRSLGIDAEPFFQDWMLPCGALGAVVIAAWLVETRQGMAGLVAPLLTRIFTPFFALLLISYLATMTWTGRGPGFHRDLLIAFDLLLAVVVGLLLYAIAGRRPGTPAGAFDVLQIVLVVAALLVDAAALWAMAGRIADLGFTPNRVAALGENILLLVNLAGSAVLYVRFVRGGGSFAALERWQTRLLPVYAAWAAIVAALFPLLFGAR